MFTHYDFFLSQFPITAELFSYCASGPYTPLDPEEVIHMDGLLDSVEGAVINSEHKNILGPRINDALVRLIKFVFHGKQVFNIGPGLEELFENTSLKGTQPQYLKLPYDVFYVTLREREIIMAGKTFLVSGFYVSEDTIGLDGPSLIFHIWVRRKDRPYHMLAPIPVPYEKVVKCDKEPVHPLDTDEDAEFASFGEFIQHVSHIVVNLLMYLSTPEPILAADKNYEKLEKRVRKAKGRKRAQLQRRLDIKCRVTSVLPEAEREQGVATGNRGESPRHHWRRGHYNQFWYGKNRICPRTGKRIRDRLVAKFVAPTKVSSPLNGVSHRDHYQPTG